jgi:hypothetical protein
MRNLGLISMGALLFACGGSVDNGGSGGSGGKAGSGGGTSGGTGGATGGAGGTIIAGGTGGTLVTGGTGGMLVTGGTGGFAGNPTCAQLEQQYAVTLAQAKACDPFVSALQCTVTVPDQLACPCSTYANPANQDAMTQLELLQKQYSVESCIHLCPAMTCPLPQAAGCVPNGAEGDASSCQDFWPD